MSAAGYGPRRPVAIAGAGMAGLLTLVVGLPVIALIGLSPSGGAATGSTIDATALDRWMAQQVPGSPLVGLGDVLVTEGVASGIDPRALVAIAMHESVLGTAGSGAGIHNAFGWGPAIVFPTWRANIATVAHGLAGGYVARGRDTLAAIQPLWAPVGAANDPAGLNSAWVAGVGRYYADLGGDPSLPITLAVQAAASGNGATLGAGGLATPTGGVGRLIGFPGVGTHSYSARPNNWQSDRAVDIALPLGSPLYAIDAGVIARVGGDPQSFSGRFGGARLTVVSAGEAFYYAHLSGVVVGDGERVARGQLVGFSGAANGVEHLHLGVLRADPVALAGVR